MRLTWSSISSVGATQTVLVYLPKLAALAFGCCLFSAREAGSVSIRYNASVDDVVGLQVVGTLRYLAGSTVGC